MKELNKKELSKFRESANDIRDGQKFTEKRSPFMLEVSGIPRQDDENVIDLVNKTAVNASICNFDVSLIDIVHRVSDKGTAPVIV